MQTMLPETATPRMAEGGATASATPAVKANARSFTIRDHAGGIAATLLSAVLSFVGIGSKSMWADEGFSWSTSNRSLLSLVELSITKETNGALYAFVLKLWMAVFGHSEAAMRSLSALCTVAATAALYMLGTRLASRRVATIAAALFAVNGSVVAYAQNVRHYAMVTLFACLSMLAFEREVRAPSRRSLRWWAASLCVLPLVHVLTITLAVAQIASLLALHAGSRQWRRRLLGALPSALVALPIVALVSSRDEGQSIIQFGDSTLAEVTKFVAGGTTLIGVLSLAILCLNAWAAFWDAPRDDRWPLIACLSWAAIPTILLFAASFVTPVLLGRYVLFTVPGVVLAGAFGLDHLLAPHRHRAGRRNRVRSLFEEGGRPRLLVSILAVLLGFGWVAGAIEWHRGSRHEDWRAMARQVFTEAQPADGILFGNDSIQLFFSYYRDRMGVGPDGPPVSEYPAGPWGRFGTGDQKYALFGAQEISDIETRRRRLWIVIERGLARPLPAAVADITRRYDVLQERDYGSAGVLYLVEKR